MMSPTDNFNFLIEGQGMTNDHFLGMAIRNSDDDYAGKIHLGIVEDFFISRVAIHNRNTRFFKVGNGRIVIVNNQKRNLCHKKRSTDISPDSSIPTNHNMAVDRILFTHRVFFILGE